MHSYIQRKSMENILEDLSIFPAVALLGPRQCGKSSLAKEVLKQFPGSVYLDLQLPSDINKLNNAELFFKVNESVLVCLDEVQLYPALFPILRAIIDQQRVPGRFLLLGSASKDLISHSSETLAGRIGYTHLTPFITSEITAIENNKYDHWFRGGYPDAFLARSERVTFRWLQSYIITYGERDIPALGLQITPQKMFSLLQYVAHLHGQVINWSKIATFLEVSVPTVKKYFATIEGTFLIRTLSPYALNIKKRLVKAPKLYVRDSGLLHYLLGIKSFNALLSSPMQGESWEGYALEQIISSISSEWQPYFYRTSNGTEIDLILVRGDEKIAVEFKISSTPKVTKGFFSVIEDIRPNESWIISPIEDLYPLTETVTISGLEPFLNHINSL